MNSSFIEGSDAYNSPEFRDFAMKWLGFDPREENCKKCVVELECDALAVVTLTKFATDKLRPVYEAYKEEKIAEVMTVINSKYIATVVIDREAFLRD